MNPLSIDHYPVSPPRNPYGPACWIYAILLPQVGGIGITSLPSPILLQGFSRRTLLFNYMEFLFLRVVHDVETYSPFQELSSVIITALHK